MASETILTAKNSWQEGLVMDFSPENTPATSLTSALNATLITYNGNELALQNDMGNARVESAYLPEGYVPVGTCEFGDIIYVVSYNPLINKSQIGCFPSPERNISTEEIGGLKQTLSAADFKEGEKIKNSSVKKIIYANKYMNPGDKYIIYTKNLDTKYLSDYGNTSHEHGKFPKLVKIHVVSIEDSGKIVYLDSTTKWYDDYYLINLTENDGDKLDIDNYRSLTSSGYSIFSSKVSGKLALLIELEKITGFSCSWEPFVKGETYQIYWHFNWTTADNNINPSSIHLLDDSGWKSGIIKKIEKNGDEYVLYDEKINGPESSKEWIITRKYCPENNIDYKDFIAEFEYNSYLKSEIETIRKNGGKTIQLSTPIKLNIAKNEDYYIEQGYYVNCTNINTETNRYESIDINGNYITLQQITLNDDIVNNYFRYPVIKKFADFAIPVTQTIDGVTLKLDLSDLIYYYKIAPAMPYGILEEFTQEGYIDFSKIGTKDINLHTWKYFNQGNTSTLTWGLDAYTEPGKGIAEVVFEFYDDQGLAAAYHTKDKISYNGTFTEYITFNESGSNYKLNNVDVNGSVFKHCGVEVSKEESDCSCIFEDKTTYHKDDAGVLYSNCLYLVKITVKYRNKGLLDEYSNDNKNDVTYYRWYWTNGMFNEHYINTKDFDQLNFELNLDFNAVYSQANNTPLTTTKLYEGNLVNESTKPGEEYKQLKANVTYITEPEDNIQCQLQVGLINDFNTFNILFSQLNNITVNIGLGKSYLENTQASVITSEDISQTADNLVLPINEATTDKDSEVNSYGQKLIKLLESTSTVTNPEINEQGAYTNYKNWFTLNHSKNSNTSTIIDSYISFDGTDYTNLASVSITADKVIYGEQNYYKFSLDGVLFSKFYELQTELETECYTLKPLLYDKSDAAKYNLTFTNNHFYFNQVGGILVGDDGDHDERTRIWIYDGELDADKQVISFDKISSFSSGNKPPSYLDIPQLLHDNTTKLSTYFPGITPFVLVQDGQYGSRYRFNEGKDNSNSSILTSSKFEEFFGVPIHSDFSGLYLNGRNAIDSKYHYMILSIKDSNEKLHLLNTIIPVQWSSNKLSQQVCGHNITIGDMVASLLMNVYYTTGETEKVFYLNTSNYVFLDKHSYTFTKDVVFELKPSGNYNDLITMKGLKYSDYLAKVTEKGVNLNNVNLKLNSIVKNQPLQFNFPYITPEQKINLSPTFIIKHSNGTQENSYIKFYPNVMYQSNGMTQLSQLQYQPYTTFEDSQGIFIGKDKYTETVTNNLLRHNFELLNNQIICTNTSSSISEEQMYTINGREKEAWSGLWPINKKEVLLPIGAL